MSNVEIAIQQAIEKKFEYETGLYNIPKGVDVCILEDGSMGITEDPDGMDDEVWCYLAMVMGVSENAGYCPDIKDHCTGNFVKG